MGRRCFTSSMMKRQASKASPRCAELTPTHTAISLKASEPIRWMQRACLTGKRRKASATRSEEHTSELQSRQYLVCRLLLEKKKTKNRRQQLSLTKTASALNRKPTGKIAVECHSEIASERTSTVRSWGHHSEQQSRSREIK